MLVAGQIPGVDPKRFLEVAKLRDVMGNPVTNLTELLMDAKGADQMSFSQTLSLFSNKVGSRRQYNKHFRAISPTNGHI